MSDPSPRRDSFAGAAPFTAATNEAPAVTDCAASAAAERQSVGLRTSRVPG